MYKDSSSNLNAPTMPILNLPAEGSTNIDFDILFDWSDSTDGDGGPEPADRGFGGDDDPPVLRGGVEERGDHTDRHPGDPAEHRQDHGLGEELAADVGLGGPEGSAKPDFPTPFDDGDDHHVGDPDASDQQSDRPEPEEERRQGVVGRRLGDSSVSHPLSDPTMIPFTKYF